MLARLRTQLTRKSNRLTAAYLAAGGLFVAAYFAAGFSTETQDLIYQIPGMAAPIAVIIGVLRYRPPDPRPWFVLAAGLALTTIGDWTWLLMAQVGVESFPSVADALYLIGLVLIGLALLALVRGRIPGGDRAGIIDALIVAIGAALLSWTFLMQPLVNDPFASIPEIATALAYPAIDILLLGVLVRVFLVPGRRVVALNLLSLALLALLLSDFPYAVMVLSGTYETGHVVELGWLIASVLWGGAALHPSMRRVAEPVEVGEAALPAWRLALLAAASLMAPAVLVIEGFTGRPIDIPAVAGGCILLFLLVIARLGGVVNDLRATLNHRRALESELERRALHDPLTGLANRTLLRDRLEHALARRNQQVAVLFVDLDDFKSVNDTFGHHAGDALLTSVAESIRRTVRAADTVARLGGDEFAVLVDQEASIEGASELANRVLAAIAAPIEVAGRQRSTSGSIGIAVGASGVTTAEALMREADIAMYVAKSEGKGRFTVFDPSQHEAVVRSMGLQADMERGLADREFELHYQPIISLATGELTGVEALLRWHHPTRGLLVADDFIHVAESSGAIIPIGRWVLAEAAHQARTWSTGLLSGDRFLSVNMSGFELAEPGAAEAVGELAASVPSAAVTAPARGLGVGPPRLRSGGPDPSRGPSPRRAAGHRRLRDGLRLDEPPPAPSLRRPEGRRLARLRHARRRTCRLAGHRGHRPGPAPWLDGHRRGSRVGRRGHRPAPDGLRAGPGVSLRSGAAGRRARVGPSPRRRPGEPVAAGRGRSHVPADLARHLGDPQSGA